MFETKYSPVVVKPWEKSMITTNGSKNELPKKRSWKNLKYSYQSSKALFLVSVLLTVEMTNDPMKALRLSWPDLSEKSR